jgi:hypothetical protein
LFGFRGSVKISAARAGVVKISELAGRELRL